MSFRMCVWGQILVGSPMVPHLSCFSSSSCYTQLDFLWWTGFTHGSAIELTTSPHLNHNEFCLAFRLRLTEKSKTSRKWRPQKRRPQSRPYGRCVVDTETPYWLPFRREFRWVLRVRGASGVDTEFPYRAPIVYRGVGCRDPVCRHRFRFPER